VQWTFTPRCRPGRRVELPRNQLLCQKTRVGYRCIRRRRAGCRPVSGRARAASAAIVGAAKSARNSAARRMRAMRVSNQAASSSVHRLELSWYLGRPEQRTTTMPRRS
jgi:hypothetical protein